jgi:hypothetical protein
MEPDNVASYVLFSNIYATAGNRHLCENVEQQRKEEDVGGGTIREGGEEEENKEER